MTQGVDYAFSNPDPAQLHAAGMRFAMRYVGPGTFDKHLHEAERDALWAAGLSIVLLVEGATNSALGGRTVGINHGQQAEAARRALGAPALPMYFAVDFDATAAQWPACREYLRGAGDVIGASRVGVYGGIRTMQWAARDQVAQWFFQTYAWSAGQWYPGNHVEQYHNGVALAGGTVDLCRSKMDSFGQWEGDDMASADDTWQFIENGVRPAKPDTWTPPGGYDSVPNNWMGTMIGKAQQDAQRALAQSRENAAKLDLILAAIAALHPIGTAAATAQQIADATADELAQRLAQ